MSLLSNTKNTIKNVPFFNELYLLFYKTKMWCRHNLYDNNRIVVKEVNSSKYYLDLNEAIDSSMFYDGVFEPLETKIVKKIIKDNYTVLDIGANIGYYTLLFSKLSPHGKVIAFEPSGWAISRLKRNIELNNIKNIIVERKGLSDETTTSKTHFRSSWTIKGSEQNLDDIEDVQIIKLDDYISEHDLKIDAIKIDVDGYEYKVISGAINTLKKDKPIILIEVSKETISVLDVIKNIGYTFYSAEMEKMDIIEINIPTDTTINVLCV